MSTEKITKLAVFEGQRIRKVLYEGEWWFSVIDVIWVLVGGDRPRKYWNDLKKKLAAEGYSEVSEKIGQLKMAAPDGKQRFTDCANTEMASDLSSSSSVFIRVHLWLDVVAVLTDSANPSGYLKDIAGVLSDRDA